MATKQRLIDANELLRDVDRYFFWAADEVRRFIKAAHTVDAVKVVHGRWECTYDAKYGETDVTCSCCKIPRKINGCYITSTVESCYFEDNYCPNCGAKMDGDGNA